MILVVDNYDSFTYNLVQLIGSRGVEIEVVRNDARSVDELLAGAPEGIVLSPGPGRPEDAGVCLELIRAEPEVPVLGVCLGQQALAAAADGRDPVAVVREPHDVIKLPLERSKFGRGAEFATEWIDNG